MGKGALGIPGYDDLAVDPMKVGGKGDALVPKIGLPNLPNPGDIGKNLPDLPNLPNPGNVGKNLPDLPNPGEVAKNLPDLPSPGDVVKKVGFITFVLMKY